MQRGEHEALQQQIERTAYLARQSGSSDYLFEIDDLAPARPNVWLLLAWLAICAALAMVLAGCNGGIDDEQFMGPAYVNDDRVAPPKPCPINVSACHPEPTRG